MKIKNINETLSVLDAFLALGDIDDDDEVTHVNESKEFNIRDSKSIDAADSYLKETQNQKATKDVALEVIDPDADAVDHVKSNAEYVGQMLLQCNSCKATIFKSVDDLEESEVNEDVYNVDFECPHCHSEGQGYSLLGQVGKVAEEEPEVENDEATDDEATFENDEETTDDEPVEDDEESDEEDTSIDEEPEQEYDETSVADDDDESGFDFGDEIDPDDTDPDDTEESDDTEEDEPEEEEKPKKKAAKIELDTNEALEEDPEDIEDEPEEEEEEIVPLLVTVSEFLNNFFLDPEDIEEVRIVNQDSQDAVFTGPVSELTYELLNSELYGFSTNGERLTLDVAEEVDEEESSVVSSVLSNYIDDNNDQVDVCDAETSETVFSGTRDEVIDDYGDYALIKFENPGTLILTLVDDKEAVAGYEDDESELSPEDDLVEQIVKENNLNVYKINKPNTVENFILESIHEGEDLKPVYENYVLHTNRKLVNNFKRITGYKDALDEALNRSDVDKSLIVEAKKAIVRSKKLTESKKIRSKEKINEAIVKKSNTNSKSFKTRKELSEALNELKNNNIPYRVKRSIKEGYRYDLTACPTDTDNLKWIHKDSEYGCYKMGDELVRISTQEFNDLKKQGIHVWDKNLDEAFNFEVAKTDDIDDVDDEVETIEGEVLDAAPQADTTDIVPAGMDPRDVEVVTKLVRIAKDISKAIEDNYNIKADPRLIVADMIQDLKLISGSLSVEDLEDTPINQLTKEMYLAYDGFNNAIDELVSAVTGEPITRDQARRLTQAINSLDSPSFSTEVINQAIASPRFLQAAKRGQVPFVDRHLLHESTEDCNCDEHDENCQCEACKTKRESFEDTLDFDDSEFDAAVNDFLSESYTDDEMHYRTTSARLTPTKTNIIVEGLIDLDEQMDNKIKFRLARNSKGELVASNNLSEELINLDIKKILK